ncbi:hypothetical protein [Novosphingobium sp. MMS21-SN21R]|uniref:hypothetical protein n=1 Tax=Novosphingobium sp. MMS21-SN21R TaxID=2969298 RepID=UPI00288457E2|nr:hypothetical protein [Novosphingobium sp. MMS21-SN21R]MDT0506532.1 hypothetical protein [Novosphingobium sp. MMS21-SN21R]
MTIRPIALALCLPLLATVAACGKKADDAKTAATGSEVLPGSINDAMIDLDTSTASPPMAPVKAEAKAKASANPGDVAAENDEPAKPADAPPESADTE